MDDGRGVVAGVLALEQGLGHTGLAQIAVHIAAAHAFVDGGFKIAARDVHVLPHLGKDDRHASILTNRDIQLLGGGDIILDSLHYAAGQAAFLARGALGYAALKLLRQALIGADTKLCDRLLDERNIDLSHIITR